ncbi:MAG: hypothetical protein AAGC74_07670 [Verrucomicrobiota bacterium]
MKQWSLFFALGLAVVVAVVVGCASGSAKSVLRETGRQELAKSLLGDPGVEFAAYHVSGRRDQATAMHNMRQTAAGLQAARSSYGKAPGGYTYLSSQMLRAMKIMRDRGYRFHVTSIAGSSHSRKSRHYLGVAFDVNRINGVKVGYGRPYWREFIRQCEAMGATETLGPGDPGHSGHIHVAWPRPPGL